jgi:CRP/FNR family transcriptional regulator, anaerobic regulatory protein
MAGSVQLTGRTVPCERCPLRTNPVFRQFTPEEFDFIRNFKTAELHASAGANVLSQGTKSTHLYTVLSGWAFRYKTLPDGRRQVLNFALPGDFLGLQGGVFNEMQHSVEALTDLVLCVFPREKLWSLFTTQPSLAFDLTWLAARGEQTIDEQLLSLGRRSAVERMAYLLLHLFDRAKDLSLTKGNTIQFPFTQQLIADALGMSLVHTNKTLKRLSVSKAIRWKDRLFEILDRDILVKIASYEESEPQPRPFI